MNINEVRKVVGRLKANLFKKANSHSVGMLKSNIRGTGLQFKEHQVYTFGDEIRFIDWKMLAKTGHPYIRVFTEERNVEVVVVIDASWTMLNGYNGVSKLQAAIEICCLLYLLAKESGDFVHAIVVADEIINIPKLSGERGISNFISTLESKKIINENGAINMLRESEQVIDKRKKYISMMKHLANKREIIILSDFNEFIDVEILKKLIYRSNVHGFMLLSPLDEAEKVPYMLFSSGGGNAKGSLAKFNLKKESDLKNNLFGNKLKKLKIQERYLENFVKELR